MIQEEIRLSIYKIIRAYGIRPTMFNDSGDIIYYPEKATRFYMKRENVMITIEDGLVTVVKGGTSDYEDVKPLIDQIKDIIYDYNLEFELKTLGRVIKAKEFSPKAEPMLAVESRAFPKAEGSTRTSYIKLTPKIWIIIKHSKKMNDKDTQRTMPYTIQDMYIKNDYERVQCPCHLKMAKALARHLEKGGDVKDSMTMLLLKLGYIILQLRELIKVFRKENMSDELRIAKKYKKQLEKDLHVLSRKTKYDTIKDSFYDDYKYVNEVDDEATVKNIKIDNNIEECHTCSNALHCLDSFIDKLSGDINKANKAAKKIGIKSLSCYNDLSVLDFKDTREKILYLIDGILDEVEDIDENLISVLKDTRDDINKNRNLTSYHKKFMEQIID